MTYIGNKPTAIPLTSADIEDGVISAADLGANSVDSSELVDGSIDTSHYSSGSVDSTALATDSVITAKITNVNVTQAKIADQAINEAKMQISNAPTNGYALTAQSSNTGGMTWASVGGANTPSFFSYLSSNQNIAGSGAWARINMDSEGWDTDSKYDASTNYRFTPQTAGKYMFSYGTNVGAIGDGDSLFLKVVKNNDHNANNYGNVRVQTGSAGSGLYITGSTILVSDTDDYFELFGAANSGNHFDAAMTFFTAFKLIGV